MSRPPILVFVGAHGAGKTTLGRAVAARLGWRFDVEIGERLRMEALARDPGAHALAPQPGFDLKVFLAELERDRARHEPCVVETWHPGNLAYAQLRNPAVARPFEDRLRRAARRSHVVVQPVLVGREAAIARCREPGPDGKVTWFQEVGDRAIEIARGWGLAVTPAVYTDAVPLEAAVDRVIAEIARHTRGHPWSSQRPPRRAASVLGAP